MANANTAHSAQSRETSERIRLSEPRYDRRNAQSGDGAEPKERVTYEVSFDADDWETLSDVLGVKGRGVSTRMREILMQWAKGELLAHSEFQKLEASFETRLAELGTDSFRAPVLADVPCGPWSQAVEEAPAFAVSVDVAGEIEALPGDVWVRARGDSMVGAGIANGVLVLVRPYNAKVPRRGEIVVAQIHTEAGEVVGTMKRYMGHDDEGRYLFHDGDDEPFPLPPGTHTVELLARSVGVVGRL